LRCWPNHVSILFAMFEKLHIMPPVPLKGELRFKSYKKFGQ
jgi:hypothetical protein